MKYRKDIDGLRAIAVLPVIFFHAGFELFRGGFLGVDIFFVISGYLITSILIAELANNQFSIINFYERRARRILPALFVVLLTTYLVGVVFMPPLEFREFSQSLISVVTFLSNIFFYLEIDYFSLAAEEMPLLHTWSLAIEEQYYLFFPPLLYLIWKLKKEATFSIFLLLFLLSFITAIWLNLNDKLSASFYWIMPRAWELLAGSICALIVKKAILPFKYSQYAANIGLIVLAISILCWPEDVEHPGFMTLIPVLATCCVILFLNKGSYSYKLLATPFMVKIGLLSYSLYLWHQPVFAFLRMKVIGEPPLLLVLTTCTLTLILAVMTYQYVEKPFRNKEKFSKRWIFSYSTSFIALFIALGLYGHFTNGITQRFSQLNTYADTIKSSPKRNQCHSSTTNYIHPKNACTYFAQQVTWATLGDSHIVEPTYALASFLQSRNIGVSHHSYTGCLPILYNNVKGNELCTQWLNENLTYIENSTTLENVLVGFRYSGGLFGENGTVFPQIPEKVTMQLNDERGIKETGLKTLYWQNFSEIISRLIKAGKNVYILAPIPELPIHISKAVSAFSIFGNQTQLDLYKSTSKEYFSKRHEYILNKFEILQLEKNVQVINVYDLLCHIEGCPAVIGDVALYFDDDHLSVAGAQILIERYFADIDKLL